VLAVSQLARLAAGERHDKQLLVHPEIGEEEHRLAVH
jgi:hypothetical protein